MQIEKLASLIKSKIGKRTIEKSFLMLKEASILDEEGFYDSNWFSKETVKKVGVNNGNSFHNTNLGSLASRHSCRNNYSGVSCDWFNVYMGF